MKERIFTIVVIILPLLILSGCGYEKIDEKYRKTTFVPEMKSAMLLEEIRDLIKEIRNELKEMNKK